MPGAPGRHFNSNSSFCAKDSYDLIVSQLQNLSFSRRWELQSFIGATLLICALLGIYSGYFNLPCYRRCASLSCCSLKALCQCEMSLVLKSGSHFHSSLLLYKQYHCPQEKQH